MKKSKLKNSDGKRVKEGLTSSLLFGSVENSKENGVRVSLNGKDDLVGDDLGGGVVSMVKTKKVFETKIEGSGGSENALELFSFRNAENEEVGDCVGAKDGISLLVDVSSEMGREDGGDFNQREDGGSLNGKRENLDGMISAMSDSEDGEEDDSIDGDYEYCVGDFVWGKIKSHPWWPGQIYDSSDASDFALSVKHRNRLLVAYFDGTFAWCHPSQLKPFEKNFVEMSKQSSSKTFVNAVKKAVDDIGRLVELKMTCACVPKESLVGLGRQSAENSGVKPGVLVPEGGIAKLWNYLFGPSECLTELKHVARVISINNMLEFTELKCWLSTFYRLARGYQLPLFHVPQPIPGLEDNIHNWVLDLNLDAECPSEGPVEEVSNQSLLQRCLMDSENGQYQMRKQKSIAEIMEGFADTRKKNVEADVTKRGTDLENLAPSSLRKKRKVNDEANGRTNLSSRPKRRKVTKLLESTPATGTENPNVERDGSQAKNKMGKPLLLSEKKNKASHIDNGDGSKKETNAGPPSVERKTVQRNDDDAREQVEKSFLSRERKKSKYLSPPYTNINRRQSKKDFEAEIFKVSSESRGTECMTRAAANLIGSDSPAILIRDEVLYEKDAGVGHEKSDTSIPETVELDQSSVIDTMRVKASTKDVLFGIQSTAINLNSLKKDSLDVVEGFVLTFRSSVYCNACNKVQLGRKRKALDSESVSPEKDQNLTGQKSPEQKSRRTKRKNNERDKTTKDDEKKLVERTLKQAGDANVKGRETDGKEKPDEPKHNQVARSQDKKRKDTETDGKAAPAKNAYGKQTDGKVAPASLFVTFGPLSTLPAKNDLIKLYSKFGYLNEEETDMFYNNYCGRVVFLRSSDADEAFKSSLLASPFEDSICKFELRYSSPKMQKLKEIPNAKSSPYEDGSKALEKDCGTKSNGEASVLNYVKQKLEMIGSVLANSDGKILPELKSKLEGEVNDLLDKVNTVVGSSSY